MPESPSIDQLIAAAQRARDLAYAPYSGYRVGAALLTRAGRLFSGCNVENAAFPSSVCAETVALTKAVSEGERVFDVLAVATQDRGTPCGGCRQVLGEFAPRLRIICVDAAGERTEYCLADLLPTAFGAKPGRDVAGPSSSV